MSQAPDRTPRSRAVRWLVVVLCVAAAVEAVDAFGRWQWSGAVRAFEWDAENGAARLADDPLLALPPAVHRSRGLAELGLQDASPEAAARSLDRMGRLQTSWMATDPTGSVHLAQAAIVVGDYGTAVDELSAAIARDPTSPFLHRFAALMLEAAGEREQSLDHLAEARGLASSYREPPLSLPPWDEQWVRLEGLRRRVEMYPRSRVQGLLAVARELRRRGDEAEAVAVLAEVGDHPEVRLELALWDLEGDRFADAISRVHEIAHQRLYPSDVRYRAALLLVEAHARGGDDMGAVAAARVALGLEPDSPKPHLLLAEVAEDRGDAEAALGHLRRAWMVAPADVGVLLRVARVAELTGHLKDAERALRRATVVDPTSPGLAARLVAFHLAQGNVTEASILVTGFLDTFPDDPRLLRLAGREPSERE